MKFLVFLSLFALAAAQKRGPAPKSSGDVTVVRQESDNPGDGSYSFVWETSDGSTHEESGSLKPNGNEPAFIAAQGKYAFYSPEGERFELSYVADENGYQPTASHLPTSPPIPEAIQRSLDIIQGFNSAPRAPASRPRPPARRN